MGIGAILAALELILKFGIPAITTAVDNFKTKNGREPTIAEIRGLMEGVEPPERVPGQP